MAGAAFGTVTPIKTSTNTTEPDISVGSTPEGIAIAPNGATAYVTNSGSGTVTPINTANNTAGTAITVGSTPEGVAITPDQAPTASFTVTPAPSGLPDHFQCLRVELPRSAPSRPMPGSSVTAAPPTTASPTVSHTYASGGSYSVTLTVTEFGWDVDRPNLYRPNR